jgi:adenine-specific DNA-methyltransferase
MAPEHRRGTYLMCLLHALSHCSASTGHFAQALTPRDEETTNYVRRIRKRSIWARFLGSVGDLMLPECFDRKANEVHQLEATEFLRSLMPLGTTQPLVIYADPPYSRAQYSRYYHILETLVLYDYPVVSGKGRYREARFHTDFSRIGKVQESMEGFIRAAAETGATLYLSYPADGLLGEKNVDLLDMLREHFPIAEIARTDVLAHSTLGGAPGTATREVHEDVYLARRE